MLGAEADGFLADWHAEAARRATEIVISEQVLLIFIRIYNLPPDTDLQNWDYLMVLPSFLMVNAEPTLPRLLTGWPIDCLRLQSCTRLKHSMQLNSIENYKTTRFSPQSNSLHRRVSKRNANLVRGEKPHDRSRPGKMCPPQL